MLSRVSERRTGPGLTVAAVAHRLGVAPATLRTWDRRYGIGPSSHASGAHRRYAPDDLARLEVMRRLVAQGVSPGDAARAALNGVPDQPDAAPLPALPPLEQPEELVRGLSRAATALDLDTVTATVEQLLTDHGVVAVWERVLVPVLVGAGARWEATGEGVDVEHLLSQAIAAALQRHPQRSAVPTRPVLLACAPDDQHELPLHALAAALAEEGTGCRVLGASVPTAALHAAARRTGAAVVLVWAQRADTGDPEVLVMPPARPAPQVLAAGPGWPEQLPDGVVRVGALGVATSLVRRALEGLPIAFGG